MRNVRVVRFGKTFLVSGAMALKYWMSVVLLISLLVGCVDNKSQDRLNEGYRALEAQRYDEAGAAANDYLAKHPTGPGTAEALYLQGRAYELRATESHEPQPSARTD